MPPVASKRERAAMRSSEVAEREAIGPYYRRGGGIFCIFEAIGPCGLTRTAQNSALGIPLSVPQIFFRSAFCLGHAHRMIRRRTGRGVVNCVARVLKVIGECLAQPALPGCRVAMSCGKVWERAGCEKSRVAAVRMGRSRPFGRREMANCAFFAATFDEWRSDLYSSRLSGCSAVR